MKQLDQINHHKDDSTCLTEDNREMKLTSASGHSLCRIRHPISPNIRSLTDKCIPPRSPPARCTPSCRLARHRARNFCQLAINKAGNQAISEHREVSCHHPVSPQQKTGVGHAATSHRFASAPPTASKPSNQGPPVD